MKKRVGLMLSAILASTMVLTPVYATESIDLDSMSVEDLQNLQEKISEKLKEKGEDDPSWDIIPQGVYKVGTDIKPGRFEFANDTDTVSVKVFDSDEEYRAKEYTQCYGLYYDSKTDTRESASINLSEGQTILIECSSPRIRELSKASWMPD